MISSREPPPSLNPWHFSTLRIADITPEIDGVATFHLAFTDEKERAHYHFLPGQFNMLYLPGVGEMPISLSADPRAKVALAHTIRLAGNVTRAMWDLQIGETLGLRGPFGSSWPLEENEGADVLLVAGGIGLAPLRPAIYHLLNHRAIFGRIRLLYGARSPEMILFRDEFFDWEKRGLEIQTTVDRGSPEWPGNVGVVTLLLDRLRPLNPEKTVMFSCGPEVMMRYCVQAALARGIAEERMWVSLERNMQCAVGLCGHCQLGPAFVCKDGPVFRHDRIAPFMHVVGY